MNCNIIELHHSHASLTAGLYHYKTFEVKKISFISTLQIGHSWRIPMVFEGDYWGSLVVELEPMTVCWHSHSVQPRHCLILSWPVSHSWNNFLGLVLPASLLLISITSFNVVPISLWHSSVHCQVGPLYITHLPHEEHLGCLQIWINLL